MKLETADKIDGQVLCGVGGAPIDLTVFDFIKEDKQDGDSFYRLEFGGEAHGYLINSGDPDGGFIPFEDPVAAVSSQNLNEHQSTNFQQFLDGFNRWLGLKDDKKLVDDEDMTWLDALQVEGGYAYNALKEKGLYFRVKKKAEHQMEKAAQYGQPLVWFNIHTMPNRSKLTKSVVDSIKKWRKDKNS